MKINFKISTFNISGKCIPPRVADLILRYHIAPMIPVRKALGFPVWASQKSGYRSPIWERNHGRSGNSQHCFKGKGAVDWTCKDFSINKNKLLQQLINNTSYTRIAVYGTFIHCDYKATAIGRRELFTSNSASQWTFKKFL